MTKDSGELIHDALVPARGSRQSGRTFHDGGSGVERDRGIIAGALLSVHWLGYSGWRWLLILEGIPAVIFGIATLFYLTDRPRDTWWLSEDEKAWIDGELEREKREKEIGHPEISILRGFCQQHRGDPGGGVLGLCRQSC